MREKQITKTNGFEVTMGVTAGYFHSNENADEGLNFRSEYQKVAAEVFATTGIYISAIIKQADVVYHTDWGCPVGGEKVYTISGERNPLFCYDQERYRQAVETIVERLATKFDQSTVTLTWSEKEFTYFTKG